MDQWFDLAGWSCEQSIWQQPSSLWNTSGKTSIYLRCKWVIAFQVFAKDFIWCAAEVTETFGTTWLDWSDRLWSQILHHTALTTSIDCIDLSEIKYGDLLCQNILSEPCGARSVRSVWTSDDQEETMSVVHLGHWLLDTACWKGNKYFEFCWGEPGRWSNRRKKELCQLSGAVSLLFFTNHRVLICINGFLLWAVDYDKHTELLNSKSVPTIETDQWACRMRCVCIEERGFESGTWVAYRVIWMIKGCGGSRADNFHAMERRSRKDETTLRMPRSLRQSGCIMHSFLRLPLSPAHRNNWTVNEYWLSWKRCPRSCRLQSHIKLKQQGSFVLKTSLTSRVFSRSSTVAIAIGNPARSQPNLIPLPLRHRKFSFEFRWQRM